METNYYKLPPYIAQAAARAKREDAGDEVVEDDLGLGGE